jgi:hypothetical protein
MVAKYLPSLRIRRSRPRANLRAWLALEYEILASAVRIDASESIPPPSIFMQAVYARKNLRRSVRVATRRQY